MAATRETGADAIDILGFDRAEGRVPRKSRPKLAKFLRETLGLELSAEKTLIAHARSQPARFLGYDIIVQHAETKITSGRRSVERDNRAARAAGRGKGPVRPLPAAR